MRMTPAFARAFEICPLVAILRGITPAESPAIGSALAGEGVTLIEIPLNSPDPFDGIARMAAELGERALVGAGTVLAVEDVARVQDAGGRFIVSPDTNPAVIAEAKRRGMDALPGYFTATEAFAALAAGAAGLKLFPAEGASPALLKAQRAVLPADAKVLAVGGVSENTMAEWRAAGADGFGLGSNLYKPGRTAADVAAAARSLIDCERSLA